MKRRQFDISIDHAMMIGAKQAFDKYLQRAVEKAIRTGSDEGNAQLRISFEIVSTMDDETGELRRFPVFKYKAGFSVPMKESVDATIAESSRLEKHDDEWMLINGQVTVDELLGGEEA